MPSVDQNTPLSEDNNGIRIMAQTKYIAEQSNPQKERFVFAYSITIRNNRETPVQLLSRYWHVLDGNEKSHEVEGEGVIGQTPIIEPGEEFTYTSGTALATPIGHMHGHYVMQTIPDEEPPLKFFAEIPKFRLICHSMIH
jgi:ApaG protein